MRKYKYIALAIMLAMTGASCKKFLNIVPVDNLSGNNFWQSKNDVETFTNGLYSALRDKLDDGFIVAGDIRNASVAISEGNYGSMITSNSIKALVSGGNVFDWGAMTRWKPFYDIIAKANLLYSKIDAIPASKLSERDKLRYKGEAVFVRNFCYFLMVRLYGDVPYYTVAFNKEPLVRMPMLTVIDKSLADLQAAKDYLPWVHNDPTMLGIRAMRGSTIALMMHLNMWAAGFAENSKKAVYYRAVDALATELGTTTEYRLLPYTIEDNKRLFKGRTRESLFEFYQNFNVGEKFNEKANLGYIMAHYPYLGSEKYTDSRGYFKKKFMEKIYSDGEPDLRKDLWFDNWNSDSRKFQFKKFANVYVSGTTVRNDDDMIIFRLSDAYLLAAEANAELGDDTKGQYYVNLVRDRAGAAIITSTGGALVDAIFKERVRELMGEGHYYYDLVRTKRILDKDYVDTPMPVSDFNAGGWTWPIDQSALTDNPNMTLNNFWR
jgi:hypothetical protein